MSWISCFVLVLCFVACSAQDLPWWKTAIFYQVYPRSFKDSDGDGVGDLKEDSNFDGVLNMLGITQKADYFKEIGVHAIWLSPIYKSPMADFGYDISHYTQIDPTFGTMDDFDALLVKLRSIGVKLVLDFVPNHSSDEHPWFQKSLNRDPDYDDFYIWKNASGFNGSTPLPPNNWRSIFAQTDVHGTAWQWREERQQFYLHKFVKKQPDLNYRNPNVVSNMTAVINFWLDKGVDGFRMDAVAQMYENSSFPDAPAIPGTAGNTYKTQLHIYEINQPETFSMLRSWADEVYKRVVQDGRPRAIFLEVYDTLPMTMEYYGLGTQSLEFPFNFNLLTKGNHSMRPINYKTLIDNWMNAMPAGATPNWVLGNHDNGRIADRYGPENVDGLNLLTGVLPGIKVTYNGEEIGMQDTFIRWDQTEDPTGLLLGPDHYLEESRDPERTPMQWDSTISAGFSTNLTTWLPVNPDYWWLNVAAQRSAQSSHLKVFQAMAQIRKDPVLQRGDLNVMVPNDNTLLVVRSWNNSYVVLLINMGSDVAFFTSENMFAVNGLDMDMTVVTTSLNVDHRPGENFLRGALKVVVKPKGAVLLRSGLTVPSSGTKMMGLGITSLALVIILIILR